MSFLLQWHCCGVRSLMTLKQISISEHNYFELKKLEEHDTFDGLLTMLLLEHREKQEGMTRAAIECEHCGKLYHESELKAYVDKDKAYIARTAAIMVSESKRKQLSREFKK
jgi:predicted CopG family antitoxin